MHWTECSRFLKSLNLSEGYFIFCFVPPWRQTTGCRRSQTSSWASAPWRCKCRRTWTVLPPGRTPRPQSSTPTWRTCGTREPSVRPKPCDWGRRGGVATHLPLASCLAVTLSVSLRPTSRSWRPEMEPVCVAVLGFQNMISPFRVATANSCPSGR